MKPTKACPVLVRGTGLEASLLAFEHPHAGLQLVIGTIEPGESAGQAAIRELKEEAGVEGVVVRDLGLWRSGRKHHIWSFHLCQTQTFLPETWSHYCLDDGGHAFRFFWQPLASPLSDTWHPIHVAAVEFVRCALLQYPHAASIG